MTERVAREQVAAGFGWMALMSYSSNIMSLLTTLILAKLLTPQDFGVVGIASMTIEVLRILKDMGLSDAIVYQKREDPIALNTANTILVGFNSCLFVLAVIAAPFVASFYDRPVLMPVLIVMASNLVWDSLRSVPRSLIRKNIDFKLLVVPELVPIMLATAVSIVMAFAGYGVWSLVVKTTLHSLLGAWFLRSVTPYKPRFGFDRQAAREMLSYGHVIASTTILLVLLYNIDRFYVSKIAGLAALGAFELAMRIAEMPVKNFSFLVGSVMFPVFSKLNSSRHVLRATFLKTFRYTAFVCMPTAIGLSLYGPTLIHRIYGSRWEAMVTPLRILALYALFRSLSSIILDAFKATGNPKLMRFVVTIKLLIVAVAGVPVLNTFGVVGMCWLILATYILAFALELRYVLKLFDLQALPTLKTLSTPASLSVTVVPGIYFVLHGAFADFGVRHVVFGAASTVVAYVAGIWLIDKAVVADFRTLMIRRAAV